MADSKTILLIGRSGRGKSTLANVITNTNKFKESSGSISETKKVQFEQFEDKDNGINYSIIDTPGIGDTKMSDNEVLDIIAEAVYLARNGIGQVFFVFDGRFDQYEMATYDLLRTIIFDQDITNHTTIVRTRFPEFRDEKENQKDIDSMIKEAKDKEDELRKNIAAKEKEMESLSSDSEQYQRLLKEIEQSKKKLAATNLTKIVESCQERIIYVDNPSTNITSPDDEDKEERIEREELISESKSRRNKSREILLEHLNKNCQKTLYKPGKLIQLSNDIADDYFQYLKKKEELQKELDKLKSEEDNPISVQVLEDQVSKKNSSKSSQFLKSIIEVTNCCKRSRKEEKDDVSEEDNVGTGIIGINEIIAQLQDRKAKLRKEIEEKEKTIRQKVLKHIFNNYQAISKELGGDIFLNSVAGDNNWTEINKEFNNKELIVKWLSQGFDYQQTQKWSIALGDDFSPQIDAGFCAWLRDVKQLMVDKVKRRSYPCNNVGQLRKEYLQQLEKETEILDRYNSNSQHFSKKSIVQFQEDSGLVFHRGLALAVAAESGNISIKELQNQGSLMNQGSRKEIGATGAYYAKYSFSAKEETELDFKAGDIIFVIDDSDDVWWLGRKFGSNGSIEEGVFPRNYVEREKVDEQYQSQILQPTNPPFNLNN
ncbi:SH3 domain-containing protein [endosymbiont GvMRE of Glomus versiforme]|uniref:SH3 domain-containing protein n=1 Tax=endosymbiont GvMRE of Glomus versiforme TaxID=2039283 RepID=UPI000ED99F67|nr:SH3 domain-containing protein [endosymbiont GvMRE of Glomus versiforme]RHZ35876.1 Jak pathway signal transduction adaptor molecule [endosymbiont GvMRE of Glomus versiforme]